MKATSMLLLIGTSLATPVAESVPHLNVEPSCKGAAAVQMADSQSYDACMKDEDAARSELLQSWQSFPVADRTNCASEASSQGLQSYVELLVCLQIARQLEPQNRTKLVGARRKATPER